MKIVEKQFDKELLKLYSETKEKSNREFTDLKIVNNVYLIFQKLIENKNTNGNYVECGVFMGGTLMSAVNFTKENDINFNFIGVDTFEGFPEKTERNENDLPQKFKSLYENNLISKEHLEKAHEQDVLIANRHMKQKELILGESDTARAALLNAHSNPHGHHHFEDITPEQQVYIDNHNEAQAGLRDAQTNHVNAQQQQSKIQEHHMQSAYSTACNLHRDSAWNVHEM